jgi:hypothetical protein
MRSATRVASRDELEQLVKARRKSVQRTNADPHVRLILDGNKVIGLGPSIFAPDGQREPVASVRKELLAIRQERAHCSSSAWVTLP